MYGAEVCIDCTKSARKGTLSNLSLHIHLCDSESVKIVSLKPGAPWNEVQYVLSCELGSDFDGKNCHVRYDEGKEWVLKESTDWNLAVLRCKESQIDLYLTQRVVDDSEVGAKVAVSQPVPVAKLKKQESKWGTLKRGFSIRKALEENEISDTDESDASVAPPVPPLALVQWCTECKSRKTIPESILCLDCSVKTASPSKSLTLTLLMDESERSLLIDSSLAWEKARYIIECEGDLRGEKISIKTLEGIPIASDETWNEALKSSEEEMKLLIHRLGVPFTPRVVAKRELSFEDSK